MKIKPLEFYTQRKELPRSSKIDLGKREELFICDKANECFGYKFPPARSDIHFVEKIILRHESRLPNLLLVENVKGFSSGFYSKIIHLVTPIGLLPLVKPLCNYETKTIEGKSITDGYSILRKTSLGAGIRGHGDIDWHKITPILIKRQYER